VVKKIAVVTGTRADFGLLQPLLDKIVADPETELQLIVTCMHLSPEFGMTVTEIRDGGYEITDEVEILLSSDSSVGTAKSVGLGTIGFADSLRRLHPDWLVVLGDRFEILGAASAAMLMGVPIAHIHGGERTDGAIDDSIRHAVTKMATVHFVSTPEYRKRVIQMGESPDRVFDVGAIGLDRIDSDALIPREQLATDLQLDSEKPWCVVTYHPVTTKPEDTQHDVAELIGAMRSRQDLFFIITKANADETGRRVNQMLQDFVETADNAVLFDSLGSKRYLSCVKTAKLVLGNSSSGIIEAAHLATPTVDIGTRQAGRVRGPSVFHAKPEMTSILDTIDRVFDFAARNGKITSPYYNGGAAGPIMEMLKDQLPSRSKVFFDVEFATEELE